MTYVEILERVKRKSTICPKCGCLISSLLDCCPACGHYSYHNEEIEKSLQTMRELRDCYKQLGCNGATTHILSQNQTDYDDYIETTTLSGRKYN